MKNGEASAAEAHDFFGIRIVEPAQFHAARQRCRGKQRFAFVGEGARIDDRFIDEAAPEKKGIGQPVETGPLRLVARGQFRLAAPMGDRDVARETPAGKSALNGNQFAYLSLWTILAAMTDADACFEEGMKHIGLSRHADYHSEYVGDLEDAIACFDQALALKPDHADALSEKGTALAALGRDAEAAETLARAIHLRPEIAQLWLERAGSLQRLGRYEEAIASCNETLRRRPDDADAMFCRAESLDALKQDAEALPAWDEVLGKGDLRTMNFHGRPVRMLGSDYRRLRALLARAGALARLGRTTDAIDAYRKSIDEGASRDNSVSDMFSAALAAQEAARTAYQTYIERHGDEPAVWRDAGSNFNRAGMTSDALAAYEQAIRLAPGNPDDWIGKAEVLVKSGRRTESLEAFREALRVKPGYLAASLRLARVQKEIGRGQSDAKGPG